MAGDAGESPTYLITATILRLDGKVLLIQQQGPRDPSPSWFVPGGIVEHGESLIDGLRREVREETGLDVVRVGQLAYVIHSVRNEPGSLRGDWETRAGFQSVAFAFEITDWAGELAPDDPDELVIQARFAELEDAQGLLAGHPVRQMREPLQEYLAGRAQPGTVWVYSGDDDGSEPERVPGA